MSESLNLQQQLNRVELLTVARDDLDAMIETERGIARDMIVTRYDDDGTTSFHSKLPDGTKVAGVSLTVPKASVDVTDKAALVEWAKEYAPSLLVEDITPAVPAHFVEAIPETREWVLDPKRVTELLDRVKAGADGAVFDTETGVEVAGVTHKPGKPPTSFTLRFDPDGREEVTNAYRRGDLSALVAGTPLPAIEAAGSDQ